MNTRSWSIWALSLLGVALVVRIVLIVATPDLVASGMDGPSYQASALALLEDGIFADVWQIRVFPPGYAGLLAASYLATGSQNPVWLLLAQSGLLLASAVFLARQARHLLGSVGSLVLLAALTLLPSTIEVSTSLMYEGILVPASMVLCGGLLRWFASGGSSGLPTMALSACVMVLIHPRSIVVPVAIAMVIAIGMRRVIPPLILFGAALVPLPLLALRNLGAQGTLNLSSNLGSNLAMGLPPENEAACTARVFAPSDYPRLNPADDARFVQCSVDEIRNHPWSWVAQTPEKLLDHFEPAFIRIVYGDRAPIQVLSEFAVSTIRVLSFLALAALLVLGTIFIVRSRRGGAVMAVALVVPVILVAVTSVVFYGRERFSYPSLPFALVLTVSGVAVLVAGLQSARSRSRCEAQAQASDAHD